jgi:AAA domain (dynein-related subfamily)
VEYPVTVSDLIRQLREGGYLADRGLATTLLLSLSLRRPVLLEGEVGVGKTKVAKVLAAVFGRKLIRLQCYEGISTQPGAVRVGLRPADAADQGVVGGRGHLRDVRRLVVQGRDRGQPASRL